MPSPCCPAASRSALEQQRRLVAMAPFVSDQAAQASRASGRSRPHRADLRADAAPGLWRRRTSSPSSTPIWRSWERWSWHSRATSGCTRRSAMAAEYAQSMQELQRQVAAERQRRARRAKRCWRISPPARAALITWVCAAAAVSGLLIGPIGPLLLAPRAVAPARRRHGAGPPRPQRHLVDIPGLTHQDEVGKLARSVAVFKAKSIELLQKKGELERLNLQLDAAINNMPLGLSMFDAQERLLVCNRRYARDVRAAERADAAGHGALRAMGSPREEGCAALPHGRGRDARIGAMPPTR